jgi:hypothetical protein
MCSSSQPDGHVAHDWSDVAFQDLTPSPRIAPRELIQNSGPWDIQAHSRENATNSCKWVDRQSIFRTRIAVKRSAWAY